MNNDVEDIRSKAEEFFRKYKVDFENGASWNVVDNKVNVDGDIDLSNRGITELPFKFGEIIGNFDISNNNLTDLKNSPDTVSFSFDCSNNKFRNLDNAPESVSLFICRENNIENLKSNTLKEIYGCLVCSNCNLKSLDGIQDLVNVPLDISAGNNNIENIDPLLKVHCEHENNVSIEIYLNGNNIRELTDLPRYASRIDLRDNPLEKISNIHLTETKFDDLRRETVPKTFIHINGDIEEKVMNISGCGFLVDYENSNVNKYLNEDIKLDLNPEIFPKDEYFTVHADEFRPIVQKQILTENLSIKNAIKNITERVANSQAGTKTVKPKTRMKI